MELLINKTNSEWTVYNEYLPCAQLTLSASLNSYALKCNFCEAICLRLRVFIEHILEEHGDTVAKLYNANETAEDITYEYEHLELAKQEKQNFDNDDYNDEHMEKLRVPDEIESAVATERHEVLIECLQDGEVQTIYEIEPLEDEYMHADDIDEIEQLCVQEFKEEIVDDDNNEIDINEKDDAVTEIDSIDFDHPGHNLDVADSDSELIDNDVDETTTNSQTIQNESNNTNRPLSIDIYDETQHELILFIIRAYHDNPPLWDTDCLKFSNPRYKDRTLQTIAHQIQKSFNQNLTFKELRRIFVNLRNAYTKELQRRQFGCFEPGLWFFDEISYLSKVKRRSELTLPESVNFIIADIYRQYPALWNMKNKVYRERDVKDASFQNMLNKVNSILSRTVSSHQLNLSVRRLRRYYIANRRAMITHKLKNIPCVLPYPDYKDKLNYLTGHVGPFFCTECKAITLNYDHHVAHMNEHAGRPNYSCEYCGKHFKNPTNLKIHRRIHTRELPYECKTCGRKFSNSGTMRVHERVHTGDRPYICEVCGKRFRTCSFMARHRLYHNKDNFRFKCEMCGKMFGEKARLHEHMNSHLDRREFLCNTCGKGFYARKTLRQHEQLHNVSKKHECEICGLTFAQRSGMHAHMRRTHKKMTLNAIDEALN